MPSERPSVTLRGIVRVKGGVTAPAGFRAGGVACGIKRSGRPDLALIVSDRGGVVAGVLTTNLVHAAPVALCRQRLRGRRFAAVVANSGNANACTGAAGIRDAEAMARMAARALGRPVEEVFVASTGIIGRRLPMAKVARGIRAAAARLRRGGGAEAARAIMTTDTFPKEAAVALPIGGRRVVIGGMAKGAGMIAPRMATMLCFLATDATIGAGALRRALRRAVEASFNRITVDGDTSTNDTVLCFGNGAGGAPGVREGTTEYARFAAALELVCADLARMIVRDGEGATKLVEVRVRGARSGRDARLIALAVANSPLVKTALYGEDCNWGRILAAAGRSGGAVDPDRVDLSVEEIQVVRRGVTRGEAAERAANARLRRREFVLTLDLHLGRGADRIWTTDLSPGYVEENAGYRS